MDLGKKRLFVIWNRIITPKNSDNKAIDIVLNSPSIGDLGMSGMQMQIDTHFLERFGSSFMLSILNAGVSTAAGLFSDGNQSSVQDVQANMNRSAEMALEQSLKIKPTGYATHGENINIFVARDLDFTTVF